MKKENRAASGGRRRTGLFCPGAFGLVGALLCFGICGCGETGGYSNDPLFPTEVRGVYVEMFENQSFWRGVEYELTDALAKRIEADTPYKIVSSRDRADSVISGQISSVGQSLLSFERETGVALEKELELQAVVNWKDLRTGNLLIDSKPVMASASYSELQKQGFGYSSRIAANNLAQRIVELMEKAW
ncbi:MAG TPA: LptE family protein [Sedimentisphaerales bacterium]|nr:LptE family protein [Sedimentisphaerales bacterium]